MNTIDHSEILDNLETFPATDNITVISLGGSIIVPDHVDHELIRGFREVILTFLNKDPKRKIIIVTGGGAPARAYQTAFRQVIEQDPAKQIAEFYTAEQDWIGIEATKLNARLIKAVFSKQCPDPIVTDPSGNFSFTGRVLIGSGWKPGFSTDYDAVLLAGRFKSRRVINLSNIAYIYSGDPKNDPEARPLENMTWPEVRNLVGDTWIPGKNVPFDPMAAQLGEKIGLEVVVAAGKDLNNLEQILEDKSFKGTLITPV